MKVHQITEAGVLDNIINTVRNIVPGGDGGSRISDQNRQPTRRFDPIENPCGQFGDEFNEAWPQLQAAINQAVQAQNKPLLLRILNRGPQTTTSRFQGFDQMPLMNQRACQESIRRRMIGHMANTFILSRREGGTQRQDWLAVGRSRPEQFIDIVLDPTKASEFGR